ncbi:MAG: hypothetical protein KKD28_04755 [Chloroflexi bacterium]|nr:hypothetical protein [Chloroflexota bacterium]
MKKSIVLLVIVTLTTLALTSCEFVAQPTTAPTQPPESAQPSPTDIPTTEVPPTETPPPTNTPEPTPVPPTATPEPTEVPALEPLPPEPQDVEFEAEDGQVLQGRYYPATVNPAPMIVLMHWAPGDIDDWNEIAFWLQNRGSSGTSPNVGSETWLDPTWFPPMLEGQSFGVFTFTFRGCGGVCSSFERDGWRMDALAALKTARELEGVDPTQIATFGASIGADGSPDSCAPLNAEFGDGCLGALSLSPGSYLNVPYDHAVAVLDGEEPPKPVWCFYAIGDGTAAQTCKSASGDLYQMFEWSGSEHGMKLIDPAVEPNAMKLILDWLGLVFGL